MLHNHKRKSKAENQIFGEETLNKVKGSPPYGLPFFEIWSAPLTSRLFFV